MNDIIRFFLRLNFGLRDESRVAGKMKMLLDAHRLF
jgi:hypothetical protein